MKNSICTSAVAGLFVSMAAVKAQQMGGMPGMSGMSGMTGQQNPIRNTSSSIACANVHFFVVRASTEPAGQGIIGTLATMVSTNFPGSSVEAIDYPALLTPYGVSSANGTQALHMRMMNYIDGCAKSKVVLMGYSQGAHVIGDVMCGGGGVMNSPASPPVDMKYSSKVVAMIQMGDPRHVTGKSFNVGNATMNGLFPRPEAISCDMFKDKIQSYCDQGDPFCAGGNNTAVHLGYTREYNMQAHKFVMDKLMAAGASMGGMPGMNGMMGAASSLRSGSENAVFLVVFLALAFFII